MARDVDERKKRKALRKLRKAALLAEQGLGPPLSDWEKEFLEEVEARIEQFGSAFVDPEKGGRDEPLSVLQTMKLREIDKKARGKGRGGFSGRRNASKSAQSRVSNTRQLDDLPAEVSGAPDAPDPAPDIPRHPLFQGSDRAAPDPVIKPQKGPPKLHIIRGGADET